MNKTTDIWTTPGAETATVGVKPELKKTIRTLLKAYRRENKVGRIVEESVQSGLATPYELFRADEFLESLVDRSVRLHVVVLEDAHYGVLMILALVLFSRTPLKILKSRIEDLVVYLCGIYQISIVSDLNLSPIDDEGHYVVREVIARIQSAPQNPLGIFLSAWEAMIVSSWISKRIHQLPIPWQNFRVLLHRQTVECRACMQAVNNIGETK